MIKILESGDSIKDIVKRCFPDYRGRKIKVQPFTHAMELNSYWDGGSRDYWTFYDLKSHKVMADVHSNHPAFEPGRPRHLPKLPDDVLLLRHSIFMGKDIGITIYANQANIPNLLP